VFVSFLFYLSTFENRGNAMSTRKYAYD
jgi:hypothetical protein